MIEEFGNSALISQIEAHLSDPDTMKKKVAALLRGMREALDSGLADADQSATNA